MENVLNLTNKQKKWGSKDYILYDYNYIKFLKIIQQNSSVLKELWKVDTSGSSVVTGRGQNGFGVPELFINLDAGYMGV